MSRRESLWAGALASVGALGLGAFGYATQIEPQWIEVVSLELRAPRLPAAFDGYRIYQISDLHTHRFGIREQRVRTILGALPPADLIAVTGDLIHTPQGIPAFLELAKSFQAKDGVYAVFGNSEHKNGVRPHAFARTLADAGIIPLLNTHTFVEIDGIRLAVAGVDDGVTDNDRLSEALNGIPDDLFTLLLMHSPDGIAEAVCRGVDVALSGHTHGGQVRFPVIGAPFTHSAMGRRISAGYYAGGRLRRAIGIRPGRTQMYITRGLGVSGLALRFLCRPEFTIITLRHGSPHIRRLSH